MAIKTVNSQNLAEYVAERQINPGAITSQETMVTEVQKTLPQASGKDDPVVNAVEETVSTAPDPGSQKPSAADKERTSEPVQKRINELTRARKEAEEFAETEYEAKLQAQRRVTELEEQVKALTPKVPQEPELKEPDPTKYTDQEVFNKDWKDYQRKTIEKQVRETIEAERAAERQAKEDELLVARVNAARDRIPDFDEVITSRDKSRTMVPSHIIAAIRESEVGAEIAYHLAKNPDEEKRIYGLSPAKALLALGKIELEYTPKEEVPAATKTPVTTRAPAPISTLKGDGGAIPQELNRPMSFQEYKVARLQELRTKNRR